MAPLDLALHHERLDRAEAGLLACLAHPVRVRILHIMDGRGVTAKQVAASLGVSIQEAADHLEALRETGLLQRAGMFGETYGATAPEVGELLKRLRARVAADVLNTAHTQ